MAEEVRTAAEPGLDEARLHNLLRIVADLRQQDVPVAVDETGLRSVLRPLADSRLAGVPCAVRVARKRRRYFNCSGLEIGKDSALGAMGGLVWHISLADPVQSSLRRFGKFISLQDAYAVAAESRGGDTSSPELVFARPILLWGRHVGCQLTFISVVLLFFLLLCQL